MRRDAFQSERYYVYGAGAGENSLSYIGLCDQPPEEIPLEIFRNLLSSTNETLCNWASKTLEEQRMSVFEIQACSTPDEAGEVVDCWTRYFKFLGMPLIEPRR